MAKLFFNISKLYSLKAAAKKEGRRPQWKDLSPIKDGALLVDKGKILWLGKRKDFNARKFNIKNKIDLQAKEVLPAFTECHTHLVFSGNRSNEFEMRNRGSSYQEIAEKGGGIVSTVKDTRKASLEELLKLGQRRSDIFLQQGVTNLEVKSGYGLDFKTERKLLEVLRHLKGPDIYPTYLGPHALPPGKDRRLENYEKYIDQIIEKDLYKVRSLDLARRVDIFIENAYFNMDQGERYIRKAKSLGFDFCIHADQLSRTGASLLGAQLGAKSVDHVVEASAEDIKTIAQSQTTVVMLPGADHFIHAPYPNARRIIDSGASFALATDFNPGTCPSQDLSYIGVLARLETRMTLAECIVAYTYSSAKALGIENEKGSLEVGKTADFISLESGIENSFYSIGYSNIHRVYKSGVLKFRSI